MSLVRYTLVLAVFFCSWGNSPAEEGERHWAYQPVVKPEIPAENGGFDGNGIDYFLGEIYRESGVTPTDPADRYTLLRRLSINLTGLPPTPAEIADFIEDASPGAYGKVVDRLLDSPHYGERWGRHWLDVARYVQGTVKVPGVDQIDLAEEYRDYVVRAFNSDKPYDQFITEQLAGDLLEGDELDYLDRKIAPAFLSIGPWFDECTDPNKLKLDIVDEQISTLTKAFIGLDFACSRCHDHKVDPIPTRDYYAMAGIFRSTQIIGDFNEFWKDGRFRMTQPVALPKEIDRIQSVQNEIEKLEKQRWSILSDLRKKFISENEKAFLEKSKSVVAQKQMKAWEAEDFSGYKNLVTVDGKFTPAIKTRVPLDRWVQYDFHLDEAGEFLLYLRYATDQDSPLKLELNRTIREDRLPLTSTGGTDYTNYRWQAFGPFPFKKGSNRIRLMTDKHEVYPTLDAVKIVKNTVPKPGDTLEKALWRYSHSKTFWPPMISEMELLFDEKSLSAVVAIDQKIAELRPQAEVQRTLSVADRDKLIDEPIRSGGNVYQLKGDPVPRGVPSLIGEIANAYPVDSGESGRKALAGWMTDKRNALTARVMVNRIWHWHFGKGIVSTTDNFGIQGSKPIHPELLDWLAAEFMENDWSIKYIQKLITTSNAYKRSVPCTVNEGTGYSEEESFLAAFPKRRLEAEVLYDGMLGSLDKVVRQPSGAKLDTNLSRDRALYILVSGRSPRGLGLEIRKMFNLFGFDPSGRPMHERSDAVTPDQALWFLNNPLPKYYADQLAASLVEKTDDRDRQIEEAFLRVIGCPPSDAEKKASASYYDFSITQGKSEKEALSRVILGLYSSEKFTHLY